MNKIEPQKGFQYEFLTSSADIVIGGSAAGVGKTYALLLDFLYNVNNKDFGGVIFRRTSPQIRNQGGLWDTSLQLYSICKAEPRESDLSWKFKSGSKLKFSHLEYEKNVLDWQGSQIPFIGFDELTHFSEYMFFYLLSRNRSACGVKPRVRATCNPDPSSWVYDFISWWIDSETGFPIKEREGVVRYFLKDSNSIVWGDSKNEVIEKTQHILQPLISANRETNANDLIKSVTFIAGSIYDNKELLKVNPEYLANLLAQDEDTKNQLLSGNWKISNNKDELIDFIALKNSFTNSFVSSGKMYISADIALKGSDLFICGVWNGLQLIDISIIEKSNGAEVINELKKLAKTYKVPNSNIAFDNDGVGGFVDGFIIGAREFNNGATPFERKNYANLKTQCAYLLADKFNNNEIYITENVANKVFRNKKVSQLIENERRCLKRDKSDSDGKLKIIPKEQMKNIIGHSPDFLDMFIIRMYFELFDNYSDPLSF